MSQGNNRTPEDAARVLLFSMRNLNHYVARCAVYEFEDVISSCESADVIAPAPPGKQNEYGIDRYVRAIFGESAPRIDGEMHVDKEYELFFACCPNGSDLRYLEMVEGVRDKCQRLVCMIGELWPSMLSRSRKHLEVLRHFDCIFSNLESSVDAIHEFTGRPCHFLPFGVDALAFCPYPNNPARTIDVYSMGRRHAEMHKVLLARADLGELFYVYDTVTDFRVIDPHEHRSLLTNLIKRSRYFTAYPPMFDRPYETGGRQELGARYFEGAAGGAIVLGGPPQCAAYDSCFDWPDAVISTAPDGGQIAALIADLDSNPERLARIRRDNVVNSLRRHDWVYRWRRILDSVGLRPSAKMVEREERLDSMARAVGGRSI